MSCRRSAKGIDEALNTLATDKAIQHSVVYDLGGGTFDVTLLKQQGPNLTVLATAGDVALGGIDWTRRISDQIAELFLATYEVDPRQNSLGSARLDEVAERVKQELSSRRSVMWEFAYQGHHMEGQITREQFEVMTSDLLYRTQNRLQLGFFGLSGCTRLRSLKGLEGMSIANFGMASATGIKDFSVRMSMTISSRLDVTGTGFSDMSLLTGKTFTRLELGDCTKLRTLRGVETMPNLEVLNIMNTAVTQDEVDRIKRAKPSAKVSYAGANNP